MRFKLYLVENEKLEITDIDINKIRKDCSIFINWQKAQEKLLPIYRGKNGLPNAINKLTRRKNRIPMNTRPKVNRILDDLLNKKFHWKPRSSGVFTSGKINTVSGYGAPNLFFPIGNYRYVWNTKEEDLFINDIMGEINFKHTISSGFKEYKSGMSKTDINWAYKGARDKVTELLKGLVVDCIDYDLDKAIQSGHEIMFDCDKYYLVSHTQAHFSFRELDQLPKLFTRIIG